MIISLEDWVHDNPRKAYHLLEALRNKLQDFVDMDDFLEYF